MALFVFPTPLFGLLVGEAKPQFHEQTQIIHILYMIPIRLLLDSKGEKMGKSQGKPVWLDPNLTSPFDFFQFWRNVADEDVRRFLLLFTDLELDEVEMTMWQPINAAKKSLAFWVTGLVHGFDEAEKARDQAEAMFERGEVIASREVHVTSPS